MSGNNEDDAAQEVPLSSGSLVDEFPTNQEQQATPSDGGSVNAANDVHIAPDETRVTEDGGKHDAFVDFADEIENSEPQMDLKAKDNQQHNAELNEIGNGTQVNDSVAEIEHLRHMLEQATAERDDYAKKYEDEGKALKELHEKYQLAQAEDGSKQLMEQLKEHKAAGESENEEISQLKAELEQERTRYASNKEKLSVAVTKGKGLVQQRDSLKQSLAEKESELDKCMVELNEKSSALETAKQNTDSLVASLQDSLAEKDVILQKCEGILLTITGTDEYQSMDIIDKVRYLSEERDESVKVGRELRKLVNALSSFEFPETVKLNGLDAKIVFLIKSVDGAQEEASKLRDEIVKMKEAAHDDIGRLNALLTAETQEKDHLQVELADLRVKHDKTAASEHKALVEKDKIISMLQEASGVALDDQGNQNQGFSGVAMIVDTCISKIKEDSSSSFNLSDSIVKNFEKMQNLLYVSNMNLELYGKIMEEEIFGRSETNSSENGLVVLRNELDGEKDSLQKDIERSEEKASLLREKLSIAVKKGKGLYQERESLKKDLDEKSNKIEDLKLELRDQRTACNDLRDQINKLTVDSGPVPQLETDIFAIQEQKNQVEKFLAESNSMLQKVLESIDRVGLPDDKTFDDPVEKVNWLAGFLGESQGAKILVEQDLERARKDATELADEMERMKVTVKSLKDALSAAKTKISVLKNEQDRLVASKTYVEQELKKAIEENSPLTNKIAEVRVSRKVLKNALQDAERNIAQLIGQKEAANSSRAAAETELMRLQEEKASREARDFANKKEDAQIIVKSLKEALSDAENKISELIEEKKDLAVSKTGAEQELKRAIDESGSLTDKFAEVCLSKISLEEALLAAERNITQLTDEKEAAISRGAATEIELEKVKKDVTIQTSKLSEAAGLKQSLEEALSQAQENLSQLAEDNKNATSKKTDLENELKRLKEEADSHVLRFSDANATSQKRLEERNLSENEVMKLKDELEKSENSCNEMRISLEKYMQPENNLKERETDPSSKEREEDKGYFLSSSQTNSLLDNINRIDVSPTERDAQNLQLNDSSEVEKLLYIVDSYAGLKHQISLLSGEKEKLHTTIDNQVSEIEHLRAEIEKHYSYINERDKMKNELSDLARGLETIIQKLGGDKSVDCKKEVLGVTGLLKVLETQVVASNLESTNLKAKAEELNYKLLEMQKVVDNLSSHKKGVLEPSSSPAKSDISEIQEMGPVGKNKASPALAPVQLAPHPRILRKGSSDNFTINVDSDSEPLMNEEKNQDKGHVFKSLNTSGLIPVQGKTIADRVDGMWVSSSRTLKNHPRARLGVITYWLLLHLWLLGSIL